MLRLSILLYSIIGSSLAGVGVIIALVMGMVTAQGIITGAVFGALAAMPTSWLVAREIMKQRAP